MVVVRLPVGWEPFGTTEAAFKVQVLALVVVQRIVVDAPQAMLILSAVRELITGGAAVTLTVQVAFWLPLVTVTVLVPAVE